MISMLSIFTILVLFVNRCDALNEFETIKPICTGDQHRDGKWVYDSTLIQKGKSFYCCGDGDERDKSYNHSQRCANPDYMLHHGSLCSFVMCIAMTYTYT